MPKDRRLYMTFPIDFHRHPKLLRLPVEVRWTFVEMNGEARLADNDGRFSAEDAEFMWPLEHLEALVTSHPTRPLVVREHNGGDYVIREFAAHQQTKADRDELSAKRAEAGRKGGLAKAQALASNGQADGGNPEQSQSQSQSQSHRTTTHLPESQSGMERARDRTDAEISPITQRLAGQAGLTLDAIARHVHDKTGREISLDAAYRLGMWLLAKAKTQPTRPHPYVMSAITRSTFEVQQYIDQESA